MTKMTILVISYKIIRGSNIFLTRYYEHLDTFPSPIVFFFMFKTFGTRPIFVDIVTHAVYGLVLPSIMFHFSKNVTYIMLHCVITRQCYNMI